MHRVGMARTLEERTAPGTVAHGNEVGNEEHKWPFSKIPITVNVSPDPIAIFPARSGL